MIDADQAPKFVFQNDGLGRAKADLSTMIEQERLPNSIRTQVDGELRQLVDVCNLLKRAETTRDFLLVTGGPADETLLRRMEALRLSLTAEDGGGPHVNKILKNVHLSQLDEFIEALSLLRAKKMIGNGLKPYSNVAADMSAELPAELCAPEATRRLLALNANDAVLFALHGFVSEMLSPGGQAHDAPDGPLRDFLYAFLGEKDKDELANDIVVHMEAELKNQHAVALMMHLVRTANKERKF